MNIFSKKISFILSIMMLALTILPVFSVNAATTTCSVSYGANVLPMNKAIVVKPGTKLKLQATGGQSIINFVWDPTGNVMQVNASSYDLEIGGKYAPSNNNEAHYLYVSSSNSLNDYSDIRAGFYRIIVSSNHSSFVSLSSTLDGKAMTPGGTYEVVGGETFSATANTDLSDIAFISYYFCNENENPANVSYERVEKNKLKNGKTLELTIPTYAAGTEKLLFVEAVDKEDVSIPDDGDNKITKTGWIGYRLKYLQAPVTGKDVNVTYGGKTISNGATTTVNVGDPITISAVPADKVLKLKYKWDSGNWNNVEGRSSYTTSILSSFQPGSTHYLYVNAEYTDGTLASQKTYKFVIPASEEPAPQVPVKNKELSVKYSGNTVNPNTETLAEVGKLYYINVTPAGKISDNLAFEILYRWDDDPSWSTGGPNQSSVEARIPTFAAGTTHQLHAIVHYFDNTYGPERIFIFRIPSDTTPVPVRPDTSRMQFEPWMERNIELENLAISLRNDSEKEGKANKNIYALNEIITYYIDYKNGSSKDITSEVSIRLELPIDMSYDVISTDGGTYDATNGVITWKFADGLEEDEDGTLTVKIRYTAFSKKRDDSKTIYPLAAIYKGSREEDNSAVINFIIAGYDTEIELEHEPYMYGDLYADTFRPNDGITRAEGALVLARIYGLDYLRIRVTDLFTDLNETYLEAQKAIVACAQAGIIKGYDDRTFRPNEKMTKAQFMSLLARMIQMNAEENRIEGLTVKDLNKLVKVYADKEYDYRGKRIPHWALKEVTMLARLNMTPLSKDDDELDLDKDITRAEVAQLVNFYLLRAPATVTSKTNSGFSDVTRRHTLFADIIEATRDTHTFSIDSSDGTERAR